MGGAQYDEVPVGPQPFRRPADFAAVVLDMFEDVNVEDGVEAVLARQRSHSSKQCPARRRQWVDAEARLQLAVKIRVWLQARP